MISRLASVITAISLCALALTGCTQPTPQPRVLVTTNILGDIVQEIVGDQAEVTVLMKPNADPHSFGISAQQTQQMQTASLIVFNGLGLEEGVLHHVSAAAEAGVATFEVGEAIDPLQYQDGDTANLPDPHFWTDPARVITAVDLIADQVIENVPGVNESKIREQTAAYVAELTQLHGDMESLFDEIPSGKRKLITNHHVFAYLADVYDFTVVGAIIPSGTTLSSPSASDLASLVGAMRTNDIAAIFVDSSHPDRLAQVIAEETGMNVDIRSLYSESLGEPGTEADTYLTMMRFNAGEIADALTP